ncbi:Tn3 family transposase [Facilibium subflavum]|uniref:Tn3 family transposase n=1 Tax=Facilibium subflavum TaxID=2219058 RepID=UPI000E657D53|nr:Tn3 family transposase [Facilibium subflavum]
MIQKSLKEPLSYKEHLIRPKHKVSKDKIINQWDNIKQIIAYLVLKKSNQSILIRKLTDNKFKNETKEALWAYNDILRSEYIYRYIDDEQLRKSVRKALNRTEAYHQLKRTVATVNSDKLNGKNDECLTINDACARLLCEVILYYNATILSGVLAAKEKEGRLEEVERIKKVSIIAWSHVNLHGNYTFKNRSKRFNWNQIIKKAASTDIQESSPK